MLGTCGPAGGSWRESGASSRPPSESQAARLSREPPARFSLAIQPWTAVAVTRSCRAVVRAGSRPSSPTAQPPPRRIMTGKWLASDWQVTGKWPAPVNFGLGRSFAAAILPQLFGTNPRSHHKGATSRVPAGDQQLPVLCHCQLGQTSLHLYVWNDYMIHGAYGLTGIWSYIGEFIHRVSEFLHEFVHILIQIYAYEFVIAVLNLWVRFQDDKILIGIHDWKCRRTQYS